MMRTTFIDVEMMRSLFSVVDGGLIRKKRTANCNKIGDKAGSIDRMSGYARVSVYGSNYLIHRVIFAIKYGYVPSEIDHANGNKLDNRPENLRPANHSQNLCNVAPRSPSGFKGVYWHSASKSWSASITVGGRLNHLGLFSTPEDANEVRQAATSKHHGVFAFNSAGD